MVTVLSWHTVGSDASLLSGGVVEDGSDLEDLQVVLAIVGDGSLDLGVTSHLELDIERSGSPRRSSSSQGGKSSETGSKLHIE